MSAITLTPDGKITLDAYTLLEALPADHQRNLIDTLSCQDAVIRYVTQQILDGWTEQSSRGFQSLTSDPEPQNALDWAIREVAKRSGDVAAKEIVRLEEALKRAEDRVATLETEQRNDGLRRYEPTW